MVLTAFTWVYFIFSGISSASYFFVTDGYYDFSLAPLFTYIKVTDDKIAIARVLGSVITLVPNQTAIFGQVMILVLVYLFYHQFRKLKKHFRRALGKRGQFTGDMSVFRRRH